MPQPMAANTINWPIIICSQFEQVSKAKVNMTEHKKTKNLLLLIINNNL